MGNLPCKICNSELKEFAENLILKGLSTSAIAKELSVKGLSINQASVNRHKSRHMANYADKIKELAIPKGNVKYDRNDFAQIDVEKIFDLDVKAKEFDDIVKEHNTVNHLISSILKNQLAIVLDLQEKFIRGDAKYPYEEIRGLHTVQEMSIKYQTFSKDLISELKKIYDQHLTDKEKLLAIQAEKQKFDLEKDKGVWLKTSEVYSIYSKALSSIAHWIGGLPDILELECGINQENRLILENVIDKKRSELYEMVLTCMKSNEYESK